MVDISRFKDENGKLRLSGGYSGPTCYRAEESHEITVYADTVRIGDRTFPRCVRAVGIDRCTGAVTDAGTNECGGH